MRTGRWIRLRLLAAVALAAGGGCAAKPYARDPLVRGGWGVRGDHQAAAKPAQVPAEPARPEPPPGPTLGGTLDLTSR